MSVALPLSKSASFYFCQDDLPDDFLAHFQNLTTISTQHFDELVSDLFIFLDDTDLVEELNRTLELFASENNLDLSIIKSMFKSLLVVVQEATRLKLTAGQLYSDLQNLKLDAVRASKLCQAWKRSFESTPDHGISKATAKRLVDMEWKFGVTASNSEVQRVGSCYIQLKLILAEGSKRDSVMLELSLPQFYDFMHEMEKARLQLDAVI